MVYVAVDLTKDAFVNLFVNYSPESNRWPSCAERAAKAKEIWNRQYWQCYDLDWNRTDWNQNGDRTLKFHLQM